MRAVLIEAFRETPRVVEVPDRHPPSHGVVVAVAATGVCRSDWHAWQGHDPDVTLPHVPGHELAGAVVAVGADVRRFRPGDLVTTPFVTACGTCPECAAGHQQVCRDQTQPGFTGWGSFAQYVALDHADVNLVDLAPLGADSVTAAAALGCRVAMAFRAVTDVAAARAASGWPCTAAAVSGCPRSPSRSPWAHGWSRRTPPPPPAGWPASWAPRSAPRRRRGSPCCCPADGAG